MSANAALTETNENGDAPFGRWSGSPGPSLHDRVAAWVNEGGAGGDDESAAEAPLRSTLSVRSSGLRDYDPRTPNVPAH